MAKRSAGILVYRRRGKIIEILLGHPGGPYWAKKDASAWSVPKGEVEEHEELLMAARREFTEELGQPVPEGKYIELGSTKISSGKEVFVWAVEGDLNVSRIVSNMVTIEWPPRSGKQMEIPELDRAAWISLATASAKLHKGQVVFAQRLAEKLDETLEAQPEQQSLL